MQFPDDLDRQQGVASSPRRVSPSRKLIHLAMAVVPAAGWWLAPWVALTLAGLFLGASLVVEAARRGWPWVNRLLWTLLPTTFRPWEERRVLGSTWFALGMAAAFLLFGRDVGGTAVLCLAWGDPAAEFVGRRWGRPDKLGAAQRRQRKSLAGSLACLGACLLAGLVGVGLGRLSPWAAVAGAATAALVERWSLPPDDNVWIPILSGLAIFSVQWLAGGQVVLFPLWL